MSSVRGKGGQDRYTRVLGLLVPHAIAEQTRAERAAHAKTARPALAQAVEEFTTPVTAPEPSPAETTLLPLPADSTRFVRVFDPLPTEIAERRAREEETKADRQQPKLRVLRAALDWEGQRPIPAFDLAVLRQQLTELADEMPNFAEALTVIGAEVALAMSGNVANFRLEPLVLTGAPGIGKTRFATRLAGILGGRCEKIAMGATSANFELAGVSNGWGTARPGRIASLLAESRVATPLLLLDELDKVGSDQRYPVLPVLLDLLERDSAAQFRDECLEMTVNASHLFCVGTANEGELMPAPLLSRVRLVAVRAPSADERRSIVTRLAQEYAYTAVDFADDALDRLADNALDMRTLRRLVREAVGLAVIDGRPTITGNALRLPPSSAKVPMGFH